MAGGLSPGSSLARQYWAPGSKGILAVGPQVIQNSILHQDPGKLHRWVADGGQRSHAGVVNLQPSGQVGRLRKRGGNLKATKGTSKGAAAQNIGFRMKAVRENKKYNQFNQGGSKWR